MIGMGTDKMILVMIFYYSFDNGKIEVISKGRSLPERQKK